MTLAALCNGPRRCVAAGLLAVLATPAHAHLGATEVNGFAAGLLHPFTGLDHLLAMLAVGIWAATMGRPMTWVLPLAFPLLMAAGAAAAVMGVHIPAVEPAVAASVLILGLAIALAWHAPRGIAITLVGTFGFLHGFAHGTELPAGTTALHYAGGFLLATAALHLSGLLIGQMRALPSGVWAIRAGGTVISLAGAGLLASLGAGL